MASSHKACRFQVIERRSEGDYSVGFTDSLQVAAEIAFENPLYDIRDLEADEWVALPRALWCCHEHKMIGGQQQAYGHRRAHGCEVEELDQETSDAVRVEWRKEATQR